MTKPVRLRLQRKGGFDLQFISRQTNGLPGKTVIRGTSWGNPFRIGARFRFTHFGACSDVDRMLLKAHGKRGERRSVVIDAALAVALYDRFLERFPLDLEPLRGCNLFCYCAPDAPCHADILLRRANAPEPPA